MASAWLTSDAGTSRTGGLAVSSSIQTPRLKASGAFFTGGSGALGFEDSEAFFTGGFGALGFEGSGALALFGVAGALAFTGGCFGRCLAFGSRCLSACTILRNSSAILRRSSSAYPSIQASLCCEGLPPKGARPSNEGCLPSCSPACWSCGSGSAGG